MSWRTIEQRLTRYFESLGIEIRNHGGEPVTKVVRQYVPVDADNTTAEAIDEDGVDDLYLTDLARHLSDDNA